MQDLTAKTFNVAQYLIKANFYCSLAIVIFGAGVSLSEEYTLFEFNSELYGEMANNLRIIMVYLAFTEILIFFYCFIMDEYHFYIMVGLFLLIMIGSLEFYGEVNSIEIDPDLNIFLLYAGISHMLFGALSRFKQPMT